MPDPVYLTRGQWGGTLNNIPYEMDLPADHEWVHHSVTNEDIGVHPTEDAIADFLELDALGVAGGISYSEAIHPNGTIGEGQGTHQGAHTGGQGCNGSPWGWNPCSFGVCFIGDFHPRESNGWVADELTDAAINSYRWLRDKKIREGKLAPGIYPTGGHRDAPGNSTACPGDNIESRLDELRQPYVPSFPGSPPSGDDDVKLRAVFCSDPGFDPNSIFATDGMEKRHMVSGNEWQTLVDLGLMETPVGAAVYIPGETMNSLKEIL